MLLFVWEIVVKDAQDTNQREKYLQTEDDTPKPPPELTVTTTPDYPSIVVRILDSGCIQVWCDEVQVRAELHNYVIDYPLVANAIEVDEDGSQFVRIIV